MRPKSWQRRLRRIDPLSKAANLYICVRGYQGWLENAMLDLGFDPWLEQAVMVKHLTAGRAADII